MKLFVETHVRSDDFQTGCSSSWIAKLNTLWYVGFQLFFLLSYNFLQFDEFIFSFHDTYNSYLKERYWDDPSTHPDLHPDLWLEAGLSGGLDRYQVYELSNATIENLWMARSVSTIGCSQSIPSTQTPEIEAMLDQ